MRLLVVEDETRIADFLARALRRGDHEVEVLGAGLPAVATLTDPACRVEAVVLDLGLPDIDGLEVLVRLCASGLQTPTIVVSAHSGEEEQARARWLGARDFLVKPFPLAALLASVGRLAGAGGPKPAGRSQPAPNATVSSSTVSGSSSASP